MFSVSFRTFSTSIFIVIFSLLSFILIYVSDKNSQNIAITLSQDIVTSHSGELNAQINKVSRPLISMLDTLAMAKFMQSDIDIYDPQWLKALSTTLAYNPFVSLLYFSDDEGTTFSVRPIYNDVDRIAADAPEKTSIIIIYSSVNGHRQRIFFNNQMQRLGSDAHFNAHFDARTRPWFKGTKQDGSVHVTDPYFFYSTKTLGITFSRRSLDGRSVIAADFNLRSLNRAMQEFEYSETSRVFLLTSKKEVIASNTRENKTFKDKVFTAKDYGFDAVLPDFDSLDSRSPTIKLVDLHGDSWQLIVSPMAISKGNNLYVANFVLREEILASSVLFRNELITISIIFVVFFFCIILAATHRIAKPLMHSNKTLKQIQHFNFERRTYKKSYINEMDELNDTIQLMENVLLDFFQNLRDVARTSKPEELSESIVTQVKEILSADDCQLFTNSPDNRGEFKLAAKSGTTADFNLQRLYDQNADAFKQHIYELTTDEASNTFTGMACHSGFIIPLFNRNNDNTGALLIGFTADITDDTRDRLRFVREFIGFNEIVLEHLEQVDEQRKLFHSFVEMTATAVDIKSPYTGGHCQRVPKITKMLAAAAESDTNKFADFSLTAKNWEELSVAAWLHDCGKVTTPDHVMDKATKLETIYDRIHEIRMRYEVLKRDADIAYLQSTKAGMDEAQAQQVCDDLKQALDDEFAFIASCNPGSEFLDPDKQQRLAAIAERTWLRTLPDDIGISQQELAKKYQSNETLPVTEKVLADKPEHLFVWEEKKHLQANSKRDFKMVQPAHRYNRGELHNLMIKSGTLTPEERYNINDHIVQTYLMLDQLPYPEHLKNVPLIAGSHHEKMNGQGYPLQLKGEEIPIGGRMIAVADVFEALTACDRPYKAAKTLSHSLKIMSFMVKDEHLDGDVFDLFLTQGIYQQYADEFLSAEQLDFVDVGMLREIYRS